MKQSHNAAEALPLIVLLTVSGGFMDAYSYLCRDQVFANAQTGNILLFGVNLSTGNFAAAWRYLVPILAFTLGIVLSEVVKHRWRPTGRFHWHQLALLSEAAILVVVAFLPQQYNLLANSLLSLACGTQVESFRTLNGSGIATTMCIGNLRAATESLFQFCTTKNKPALRNGLLYFGIIGAFVLGAVIGKFSVSHWQEKAILVSAVLLTLGLITMLFNKEAKDDL